MIPLGFCMASFGLLIGFKPEITRFSIRTARYFQEENKEELSKLMSQAAEIKSKALSASSQAINEGLKETIYCKHCGNKIDSNSGFCKYCGEKI